MGKDNIKQSVKVTGKARTGDITLIGKIEQVVKVIKQPALWQDAIWRFIVRNWSFLIACLVIQGLVLLLYLQYKNLFLIPISACLALEILTVFILWGVHLSIRKKISKKGAFFSLLAFVVFLSVVGWVSRPIYDPQIFPDDKFGIAVATFGEGANYNLSNSAQEISDQIYNGLCQELSQKITSDKSVYPCTDIAESTSPILVQKIGVISDSKLAEWYAHRIGADIVIWGQVLRSGKGSTTIRFQIDETLDKAVNPEFSVVMPVTSNFTEVIIRELDYESDPVKIKKAISEQTTYVASFALGLFEYLQRDFPSAVRYFAIAKDTADRQISQQNCLNKPANSDLNCNSMALLYLYLGRSYNGMGAFDLGQPILGTAKILNPSEPATLISLAIGCGSLGQTKERDEYLNNAMETIKVWSASHSTNTSAALYDRGVIYQIRKQYTDSVIDFENLIKNDPRFYVAYLNLANSYSELGDYPKAVETLEKAINLSLESNGNPSWAQLNLAIIHEKYGDIEDARNEYVNAINSSPNSSTNYYYYGLFLKNQEQLTGAQAVFSMMVEKAWDKGWAYSTLGDFQYENGLFIEAIGSYQLAIHDNREDDALLHTRLAQAYTQSGNIQEAQIEFEKAIMLPSASYYSFAEYAGLLLQQSDYVQAADLYEKALQLNPEDPSVLINLGQAYQSMKQPDKAITIYRHIIQNQDHFSVDIVKIAVSRMLDLGVSP